MDLLMMLAFTYLPAFVTTHFQGIPGVWKSHHRLMLCWLIFMQAIYPGRKTLQEMARWTPASITAWRFARLLKATYWNIHLLVSWMAQDLIPTLPPPTNRILYPQNRHPCLLIEDVSAILPMSPGKAKRYHM